MGNLPPTLTGPNFPKWRAQAPLAPPRFCQPTGITVLSLRRFQSLVAAGFQTDF
jgi:hypothetical protein